MEKNTGSVQNFYVTGRNVKCYIFMESNPIDTRTKKIMGYYI